MLLFSHQTTVDGYPLFSSVSCRSSPLQSLRTRQIHKVEFGRQRFELADVRVARKTVVRHVFLQKTDGDPRMHVVHLG